jgi:simple sugar transport system ATP-binding protein
LLSGGNLQKLILAREISRQPKVIIAVYPVRGLDVGAIEAIHQMLIDERDRGAGILLISEDLDELLSLSDRIAVMHQGQIIGEVPPEDERVNEIGLMMAGEKVEAGHAA